MIPHFVLYYANSKNLWAEILSASSVEVFFVLSGFVLGPQITRCAAQSGLSTYRTFIYRRWMRTIPSFLVALICMSIIFGQLGSPDFFRYAFYVQNLFRQQNTNDYYAVAWSLSVEEWYYIVFPLFFLTATNLTRSRGRLGPIVITLVFLGAVVVIRTFAADNSNWGESVRRVVLFRIDSIGYGFLLYLLMLRFANARIRHGLLLSASLLVIAAASMLWLNFEISQDTGLIVKEIQPFVAAGFGCAIILFFVASEPLYTGKYARAAAAWLGRVSYSVYLFHLVVLFALHPMLTRLSLPWQFGLYFVVTIGLASVFFEFFERPILANRPQYRAPQPVSAPVSVTALQ